MDRQKLFKFLGFLIFLIFAVNFLANKFHLYYSIWYFDMIMHFLGGFWLGLVAIWVLGEKQSIFKALLFVFFIGLGWEIFEFIFNNYIAQTPFDLLDTVSDLFFDLFGGLCAILYLHIWEQKKQEAK